MLIHPTETLVLERPELAGAALSLESDWCWISPQGVFPCTAQEAAAALLDRVVDLESQVFRLEALVQNLSTIRQYETLESQISTMPKGITFEVDDG